MADNSTIEYEETSADEAVKEAAQNVAVHLCGDREASFSEVFGKRRKDEEDFWPEKTVPLEKAQGEQQSQEEGEDVYSEIIEPPLSMSGLVTAFEESNSLRQNIDAMVTNIDGFGFMLEPVIDFKSNTFKELIRDQLEFEGVEGEITEEVVQAKAKEVRHEAVREKRKLQEFFAFSANDSFIELRRASREDVEVLGNFAWEVLRSEDGEVKRFVHVPFYTLRMTKRDEDPIEVDVKRKVDPITYETATEKKRFRRYVQVVGSKVVYFKEFGDPRPMSMKTGKYAETEEEIIARAKDDPHDGVASEILHYKIRAIRGVYGLPRWIGNILSVRGSRLSEEVNFFYFSNKAIPPMIIFVENGKLGAGAVDRLSDFMEQVKGDTKKFWKVAILEGESSDDARKRGVTWTGQPRFKVVKLSSEQLKDALFQEYDANNRDKVGESFRMPRLLRGDVRDFNRATAETAKAFAEEQVFQPERDRFDAWINRILGPELDMKFWRFKTLAPIVRDATSLAEIAESLVKAGVMTPGEARSLMDDIFNREFSEIDEEWTKQPLQLTLAGIVKRMQESPEVVPPPADVIHTMNKSEDLLGLGSLGESVDLDATLARLLEIRGALSKSQMLPSREQEDRGDSQAN